MDAWKPTASLRTRYCVGFMFNSHMDQVVLIRKRRPSWQEGKLNGPGGHIHDGESPAEAMRREFEEKAGMDCPDWHPLTLLKCSDALVWFFWAKSDEICGKVNTRTDEPVEILAVKQVMETKEVLPNLPWLIQMARSFERGETSECFIVTEKH